MGQNVAELMTQAAVRHGDRPAYRLDDTVIPWAAVDAATASAS